MLFDLIAALPGITVRGIDISRYAIQHAKMEVQSLLSVANATALPFEDNTFDVVISINTLHNLEQPELIQALREVERVSRGKAFITVDAYRNAEEKARLEAWNLTAKTMLHVDEWRALFDVAGYRGDYYWFIP